MNPKVLSLQDVKNDLFSNDNERIHSSIVYIRENGTIQMLELLFDVLLINTDKFVLKDILICISDLKNKDCVPFLMQKITDNKFSGVKKDLLNAYWQTNFDFSEYYTIIATILIEDNFETGIEALTLLEIVCETLDDSKKAECYKLIESDIDMHESPKRELLYEALQILT